MIPARLICLLTAFWLFKVCVLKGDATIVVSCIGDSITAGVGVANPSIDCYPAKLQQLLGTNYSVLNYGVSGATLLIAGDTSYWNTSAYTASHNPPLPNIVIIMLGSNDSKPQNWQYGTNFYSNYQRLITTYTNLSSRPQVLICTPPPCFGPNSPLINPGIVATNISPLVRQLGTNLNHQVIDMQTLLAGHGEWFPDNVHPDEPGTSVMAAIVYTALLGDTLNGAIPSLAMSIPGNGNVVFNWPAGGAGWVVQTTPLLGGTNSWTIVSSRITNDDTTAHVTVPLAAFTGSSDLFRLWNPSVPGP